MKNITTKILFSIILFCCIVGNNFAQTYCLQLTEISNDGINSVVSVQMQGSEGFTLGSSNLQFRATDGAYGTPTLVSSVLAPPFYFVPTVTQPLPGSISLNIELAFSDNSGAISAAPGFTEIMVINLPIADADLAAEGVFWEYNGGTTQTVVFLDDEASLLSATSPSCLVTFTADISGCTDANACNFDPDALIDDGNCLIIGDTCDDNDPQTIEDVITDDCTCEGAMIVSGCMNEDACNFNADANLDDGSCLIVGDACDDNDPNTLDDVITADCICAGEVIVSGCMNADACNYNPDANTDDGSCLIIGDACDDNDPQTTEDVINVDCNCEGTLIVSGCMNADACNYNPDANTDDGSCLIIGDACDDNDPQTIEDVINVDCNCEGTLIVSGCMNADACNYNPDANTDDGSCLIIGD
ncbi:MAG: hypothetical protein ACI81Y_002644, partial [Glaciecola sp.]